MAQQQRKRDDLKRISHRRKWQQIDSEQEAKIRTKYVETVLRVLTTIIKRRQITSLVSFQNPASLQRIARSFSSWKRTAFPKPRILPTNKALSRFKTATAILEISILNKKSRAFRLWQSLISSKDYDH